MPVYTYRREDGTTFDYRQKFMDEPLTVDPETGQHVIRVVQAAGIIFKGSGFYVNDSKNASKASVNGAARSSTESTGSTSTDTNREKPAVKEVPKETSTVGAAAD